MPDVTLLTLLGKAPNLIKGAQWLWGQLPQNQPIAKAVRNTAEQFSLRLPGITTALETWAESEAFDHSLEVVKSGGSPDIETAVLGAFLNTTGYGPNTGDDQTVIACLTALYDEIRGQLLDGPHQGRLLGAMLMQNRSQGQGVPGQSIPWRPPLENDSSNQSASPADQNAMAQLDMINTLVKERRTSAALHLLEKLKDSVDQGIVSPPVRFRFFINRGVCLMQDGRWDEAETDFRSAQTLEPGNQKALINLAQVARFKEKYEQALKYVEPVLKQNPADPHGLSVRLICLYELGRSEEVAELEETAQISLSSDSHAQYTLGYIAFDQKKFDEAERYLRRHNELDASYPEAWELLGRTIIVPAQSQLRAMAALPEWVPDAIRARLEEAEGCFSRAESLLPRGEGYRERKYILVNRGVARTFLGWHQKAVEDFEAALQLDATIDEARRNLGTLFLHLGRPEDAVRYFTAITTMAIRRDIAPHLAAAYLNLSDPARARATVEPLIEGATGDEGSLLFDLLLTACQRLNDVEACERILGDLEKRPDDPAAHVVLAEYYARKKDFDRAVKYSEGAIQLDGGSRRAYFRLIHADMNYRAGRFDEAAKAYGLVPVPLDESPVSRRRLFALLASGRVTEAYEVARGIRNGRRAIPDFSEIEAHVCEQFTGDLDEANRLRAEFLEAGVAPFRQKLKMAFNLIRQDRRADASRLVLEVDLGDINDDSEALQNAVRLRTILGLPDAVVFAFRLLESEPNDPTAHLAYACCFFERGEIDGDRYTADVVGSDCVVTLRRGSELQTVTIVEGTSDLARGRLSVEHPLAKRLLGQSIGDRFRFPEDQLSEAQYEVASIQTKYVHAYQDCMNHFAERFPNVDGISRVDVGGDDFTKIVLMLEKRRARSELILGLYGKGTLPACFVARKLGASDAEMFRALVHNPQIRVWAGHGTSERIAQEQSVLAATRVVLFETSALITLHCLGLLERVTALFDATSVTQQQLDSLAEVSTSKTPRDESGYIFCDEPGHVQIVDRAPGQAAAERAFYEGLHKQVRAHCKVISLADCERLDDLAKVSNQKIFGVTAMSVLTAAAESSVLVISDDLPFRLIAENDYSVASVATPSVLKRLRGQAVISSDEYHSAILWLVEHGYHFISVGIDDVLWVLRKNGWAPTSEVASFLRVLSGHECQIEDGVSIGLAALHAIYCEPLAQSTRDLTSDLVIAAIAEGRDQQVVLRLLETRNKQQSIIWTPASEQIHRRIQNRKAAIGGGH